MVIVDDMPTNLTIVRSMVEQLDGCQAKCFTDPEEGLYWCAANMPDMVVVDYMMPNLNGIEFINRFRAYPGYADIPVLVVTACEDREVRYEVLQLGTTDFLRRPLDKIEFMARARNMLNLNRGRKALASRAEWLAAEVKSATSEILRREEETVYRLCRSAEFRDPETGAHLNRMANYSSHIARNLGLSQSECALVLKAAPMHDIGKLGTPDHILLKPGRLTAEEMDIMKRHTTMGYDILSGSTSSVLQAGAEIAHSHHEKFDGSGYPGGLRGEDIPLYGRIVAVADVFDALTSERPYKKAWAVENAVQHIRQGIGKHFDPRCVEAFFVDWHLVLDIKKQYRDDPVEAESKDQQIVSALTV